jgi:hypothetical protein
MAHELCQDLSRLFGELHRVPVSGQRHCFNRENLVRKLIAGGSVRGQDVTPEGGYCKHLILIDLLN